MNIIDGWAGNSSAKGTARFSSGPEPGTKRTHRQTEQVDPQTEQVSLWVGSFSLCLLFFIHTKLL